jgi:23S rRNA pseudouridine2605 synthase
MRINQFVAQATGLSRRSTDQAIKDDRVLVNDLTASLGQNIKDNDVVTLDNNRLSIPKSSTTILLNKPVGYVCSRDGQGAPTIYDLLPAKYSKLKHVGRLDKDSSGLVVLTDNGNLAHELTHPSFEKEKIYRAKLDRPLSLKDKQLIEHGRINLDGKPSVMKIKELDDGLLEVKLSEGRNRQIRRTFQLLNYEVERLNRESLGQFNLDQITDNKYIELSRNVK